MCVCVCASTLTLIEESKSFIFLFPSYSSLFAFCSELSWSKRSQSSGSCLLSWTYTVLEEGSGGLGEEGQKENRKEYRKSSQPKGTKADQKQA